MPTLPRARSVAPPHHANRAEIAVRIMRAATELNCATVAIYGHEDVAAWLVDERGCGTERHVAPDDRGQRPSDLARANGFDAFAERLRTLEDVVTKVPMLLPGAGAAK